MLIGVLGGWHTKNRHLADPEWFGPLAKLFAARERAFLPRNCVQYPQSLLQVQQPKLWLHPWGQGDTDYRIFSWATHCWTKVLCLNTINWALSNLTSWKMFLPVAGSRTRWSLNVPSNPNYSMIPGWETPGADSLLLPVPLTRSSRRPRPVQQPRCERRCDTCEGSFPLAALRRRRGEGGA